LISLQAKLPTRRRQRDERPRTGL